MPTLSIVRSLHLPGCAIKVCDESIAIINEGQIVEFKTLDASIVAAILAVRPHDLHSGSIGGGPSNLTVIANFLEK